MSAKPPPGMFITGNDTNVGKTYVAVIIARSMVAAGYRVGVYKPVLSGYSVDLLDASSAAVGNCQDDDVLLWRAAESPGDIKQVSPQRFRAPLAPHLAARIEGREVNAELMRRGADYWRERSDVVIVEGAGGLLSPVGDREYVADLAHDLGYPLVVVVANRLGAINQTLQTLMSAAAFRNGLRVAAVVLNQNSAVLDGADASLETNLRELKQRCDVPIISLAVGCTQFDPRVHWEELIERAQIPSFDFH